MLAKKILANSSRSAKFTNFSPTKFFPCTVDYKSSRAEGDKANQDGQMTTQSDNPVSKLAKSDLLQKLL